MSPKLKLLTYNTGLARFVLWGKSIEPMPYVSERADYLPEFLAALDADVIALQEIYEAVHRTNLAAALAAIYPHVMLFDAQSPLGLNDGLMLLSKYPIDYRSFIAFDDSLLDDRFFTRKGYTRCVIETPLGRFTVFNVYTMAGGLFRHPERPGIDRLRQRQVDQLVANVKHENGNNMVLLGDFNTGPQVSPSNYASLLHAGFVDVYVATEHASGEPAVTWDPQNPLNVNSPHRMCPPQRIDHILLDERSLESIRIRSSNIVGHEHVVPTTAGQLVTPSDHYGLLTELEE